MTNFKFFLCISMIALAGCSSSSSPFPQSGFVAPDDNNVIDGNINEATRAGNQRQIPATRNGFVYTAGLLSDDGTAVAFAGQKLNNDVDDRPISGDATQFVGTYAIAEVNGVSTENPESSSEISDISFLVDFDDLSLTGVSDNGKLSVDGTLAGRNGLTGNVTYEGIAGDLEGLVSGDEAIGVFHGSDDDTVYAGGFVGVPDE